MSFQYDDRKLDKKNSKDDAEVEITAAVPVVGHGQDSLDMGSSDEKITYDPAFANKGEDADIIADLRVTGADLEEAEEFAKNLSIAEVKEIMQGVIKIHENDPNFPIASIDAAKSFIDNYDEIAANPEEHHHLIREVFIEAALIVNHSPYAEVRAVVSNKDDVDMPSSTVRAWFIGIIYVAIGAFINQFFEIRQPRILLQSQVAQLLAHPLGLFLARVLPAWGINIFGTHISLNPGPWNKKEHMLATIMANTGFSTPYTNYIIWSQYLPQYYGQTYAGEFAYQILVTFAINFLGYGMAGLCRRFLVYPTHAVWPTSLVTIALNSTLHSEQADEPVKGPLGRMYRMGRMKAFVILFAAMFVYFWIPNMFFNALSIFNWMSWIAPNSLILNTIVGSVNGLGFNPIPTFDWNTVTALVDPLVVPFFTTANLCGGMAIFAFPVIAVWWTNAWNTGYLPINTNRTYDRFGNFYNVSRAINDQGHFDKESYEAYSPAYMGAANAIVYLAFFAVYSALVSYAILFHRHEIMLGFRNLYRSLPGWRFWRKKEQGEREKAEGYDDLHNRLMARYPEVSEWWYFLVLVVALIFGVVAISTWETYTTPAVTVYGLIMCAFFVIPVGIIYASTGVEVTLNVLAEFIGGSWVEGNALAMNYFKSFGYVTCAHALAFSSDLKVAHYTKIPPRHTFCAQIIATLVSSFVCMGVLNFQIRQIPDVCTPDAPMRLTCPGVNTFFTAAVFWGTLGPHKMFGTNGQYTMTLIGFPIGLLLPVALWYLRRKLPKNTFIRGIHPIPLLVGGLYYAPYNLTYLWPAVPVGYASMVYLKTRFLGFWSRYNYTLSAAFSCGVAISAVIQFFGIQMPEISFDWWGNEVIYEGCEGVACTLKTLAVGEYFGPGIGEFKG